LLDDGPIDIAAGRDLDLAGSATHGAPGLLLNAKALLSAGRHATVRAGNNGTTDAIVIGNGVTIQAGQMLDLRPGEVLTRRGRRSRRRPDRSGQPRRAGLRAVGR
jgi:hypothetical protein